MGFVKSYDEIMARRRESVDFLDADMLSVIWETKPEIVERLVPKPLKPFGPPLALAFIAHYPRTTLDVAYYESALFVMVEHEGEEGSYCLSMPVTDDFAMAAGREVSGFPKKIANIGYERRGDVITGWTERRGIRFMELSAELNGRTNVPEAAEIIGLDTQPGVERNRVSFNFKHFPAPEGDGLDYNPRLVRQEVVFRPKQVTFGTAELKLVPSDYDPWAELEVVRMLGAVHTVGDNSMIGAKVVAEVEPLEFYPYVFLKWDFK